MNPHHSSYFLWRTLASSCDIVHIPVPLSGGPDAASAFSAHATDLRAIQVRRARRARRTILRTQAGRRPQRTDATARWRGGCGTTPDIGCCRRFVGAGHLRLLKASAAFRAACWRDVLYGIPRTSSSGPFSSLAIILLTAYVLRVPFTALPGLRTTRIPHSRGFSQYHVDGNAFAAWTGYLPCFYTCPTATRSPDSILPAILLATDAYPVFTGPVRTALPVTRFDSMTRRRGRICDILPARLSLPLHTHTTHLHSRFPQRRFVAWRKGKTIRRAWRATRRADHACSSPPAAQPHNTSHTPQPGADGPDRMDWPAAAHARRLCFQRTRNAPPACLSYANYQALPARHAMPSDVGD